MERENSQKRDQRREGEYPLLQTEQGSQASSISNNGEPTMMDISRTVTVEIESSNRKEETSTPLITDSGV